MSSQKIQCGICPHEFDVEELDNDTIICSECGAEQKLDLENGPVVWDRILEEQPHHLHQADDTDVHAARFLTPCMEMQP